MWEDTQQAGWPLENESEERLFFMSAPNYLTCSNKHVCDLVILFRPVRWPQNTVGRGRTSQELRLAFTHAWKALALEFHGRLESGVWEPGAKAERGWPTLPSVSPAFRPTPPPPPTPPVHPRAISCHPQPLVTPHHPQALREDEGPTGEGAEGG